MLSATLSSVFASSERGSSDGGAAVVPLDPDGPLGFELHVVAKPAAVSALKTAGAQTVALAEDERDAVLGMRVSVQGPRLAVAEA